MRTRLSSKCAREDSRLLFWPDHRNSSDPLLGNTYKWSRLIGKATEGLQAVTVTFNISLSVGWSSRVQRLLGKLMRNFASHGRRSLTTSVTVPCVTGAVLIPLDSLL
jgi:hypothetical protein